MDESAHSAQVDVAQSDGVHSSDVTEALRIAGELIEAGVPVFAAPPCPSGPFGQGGAGGGAACPRPGHGGGAVEYDLPARWQLTVPSAVWLERWQPGWALAAVGGGAADFLDVDPRNGGEAGVAALIEAQCWPDTFGEQATKSGGWHYVIAPLRERKATGFVPGVDYQGGEPTDGKGGGGAGRGFIWIAPTVGRSKDPADAGAVRPYVWTVPPKRALSAAPACEELRTAVLAAGRRREAERTQRTEGVRQERGSAQRVFTPAQMEHFLSTSENALRVAQIGTIEDHANAYACALSHFVPGMLDAQAAYGRLLGALGATAYDPLHPASGWTAEKFIDVVSDVGGRAPADWHAVPAMEEHTLEAAVDATAVDGDEVGALLAEMLPPSELAARRPPRYMIKGYLAYDSEVWMVGGPGSKKSFVALDMAGHVATGTPWQGHKVNKGVVLLIIGEGAGSIGKRITAWEKEYGPMPGQGIRILPRPVQAGDPRAWAVLVRAVQRVRAATPDDLGMFIVVDTQARSTVGLDENSAEQMGVYVQALAALREVSRGCIMSVHHTTKTGNSTRGSGAQDGAQYSRLLMDSKKGSLTSSLISDKQKDMEEADPLELRFHKVDVGLDEDGEMLTSLVLTPRDAWTSALFDGDSARALDEQGEAAEVPFAARITPEHWTYLLTSKDAHTQRWLLQALADTAEDRGLTQAEWRGVVDEKLGQGKPNATAWRKAFQRVTSTEGRFGEVVRKIHGADRWTADHVAVAALIAE